MSFNEFHELNARAPPHPDALRNLRVPGNDNDCGIWSIILSLLAPVSDRPDGFRRVLDRILPSSGYFRFASLSRAPFAVPFPSSYAALGTAAPTSEELRAYIKEYMRVGSQDIESHWLHTVAKSHPRSRWFFCAMYFQAIIRWLRMTVARLREFSDEFRLADSPTRAHQLVQLYQSAMLGDEDLTVLASLLGAQLWITDAVGAVRQKSLPPYGFLRSTDNVMATRQWLSYEGEGWRPHELIPVVIRHVSFRTPDLALPDHMCNHYNGTCLLEPVPVPLPQAVAPPVVPPAPAALSSSETPAAAARPSSGAAPAVPSLSVLPVVAAAATTSSSTTSAKAAFLQQHPSLSRDRRPTVADSFLQTESGLKHAAASTAALLDESMARAMQQKEAAAAARAISVTEASDRMVLAQIASRSFWEKQRTDHIRSWLVEYKEPAVNADTPRETMIDLLVSKGDIYLQPAPGHVVAELDRCLQRMVGHPAMGVAPVTSPSKVGSAAVRSRLEFTGKVTVDDVDGRLVIKLARRAAMPASKPRKRDKAKAAKAANAARKVLVREEAASQPDALKLKAAAAEAKRVVAAEAKRAAAAARAQSSREQKGTAARADAQTADTTARRKARARQADESLDALLQQLKDQGLLTPEQFAAAKEARKFPGAVSFQRLVDVLFDPAVEAMHSLAPVCAVCSLFITGLSCRELPQSLQPYEKWSYDDFLKPDVNNKLLAANVSPALETDLIEYYDLSGLSPSLTGLLLSKSPHARADDDHLYVCRECHTSLLGSSPHPPRMSIANNNAIGRLPQHLQDISWPERAMTSVWYPRHCVSVLQGGQKFSKGHVLTVEMQPEKLAQQLPVAPKDLTFRVIIAGASTPQVRAASMHVHQVRKQVLLDTLEFLKKHSPFYKDVQPNEAALNALASESSLIDLQGHSVAEAEISFAKPINADEDEKEEEGFSVRHISHVSESDPCAESTAQDSYQQSVQQLQTILDKTKAEALLVRTGERFRTEHKTDLELIFPHDFPYGRGGSMESRRVRLGLEALLSRLVRLSDGQFQRADFVLKAYNIMARHQAAQQAFVRVQLKDQTYGAMTRAELEGLVEYQKVCSEACRNGAPMPDPPANLAPSVQQFYRSLRSTMGVMTLSDEFARIVGRVEVFAMWYRLGPPTLMVTLTPDDLASPVLMHFAGKHVPGEVPSGAARRTALADCPGAAALAFDQYKRAFIRRVIGYSEEHHTAIEGGGFFGVPIAFFGATEEQMRGSLHIHFLIWIEGGSPLSQRVLDNPHMSDEELEELRVSFGKYLNSIYTAQVQCPEEFHQCPRAESHSEASASAAVPHFAQVKDVRPFRTILKAGQRPDNSMGEAKVVTCTQSPANTAAFSVHETNAASVTHARKELGMDPLDFSVKDAYHKDVYAKPSFPLSAPAPDGSQQSEHERARFLVDVATVQQCALTHDSAHRASCGKKGAMDKCRYNFPFEWTMHSKNDAGPVQFGPVERNELDGSIRGVPSVDSKPERDALSAYQNQCSPAICALCRWNHDIKLVLSPGSAYYMTCYHVKTQGEAESTMREAIAAIERGQRRAHEKEPSIQVGANAPLVHEMTSPLQLLLRAVHGASSSLHVGANSAANMVLGGQRYPCSEIFGNLSLAVAERIVQQQPVDANLHVPPEAPKKKSDAAAAPHTDPDPEAFEIGDFANGPWERADEEAPLVDSGASAHIVSPFYDYVHRPLALESICWYEFVMRYERKTKASRAEGKGMDFLRTHPLASTHHLRHRPREVIPKILGGRVPDGMGIAEADAKKKSQYGLRLYLLFLPFRAEQLRGALAEDAYRAWKEREAEIQPDSLARRIIQNMQCYWLAKTAQQGDEDEFLCDRGPCTSEEVEQLEIELANGVIDEVEPMPEDDYESECVRALRGSGAFQRLPDLKPTSLVFEPSCPPEELDRRRREQFGKATVDEAEPDAEGEADDEEGREEKEPQEMTAEWIAYVETDEGEIDPTTLPEDLARSIKVLEDPYSQPQMRLTSAHAVVVHVLRENQLNDEQTHGFLLVARSCFLRLFELSLDPASSESNPLSALRNGANLPDPQLLMHLAGAAGTGKSRVIQAIRLLYRLLRRSKSLLLSALTGTAAVAVHAQTLHHVLSLMQDFSKKTARIPDSLKARWQEVTMLIIDEISMLSAVNMQRMDYVLRKIKDHHKPFGGVSIIFVGDLYQLPPVMATSLMNQRAIAGCLIWRKDISTVVFLEQQMRQAEDPEYARHLESFRSAPGQAVNEDSIAYFNSRVCGAGTFSAPEAADSDSSFIPVVVFANQDRRQINRAISTHCVQKFRTRCPGQAIDLQFFEICAFFTETVGSHKKCRLVSRKDDAILFRHLTSPAARPAGENSIFCFIGMKVIVTENLCVSLGIANGSEAIIQRIQLTERAAAAAPILTAEGVRLLSSADIACLILRLLVANDKGELVPSTAKLSTLDVGPGEFAVFNSSGNSSITIDLPALKGRRFRRWQLPIMSTFCLTAHKVQGQTMKELIFATNDASRVINYVVFSRCRSLTGIHLLRPLPVRPTLRPQDRQRQTDLDKEMKRLRALAERTKTQFSPFYAQFKHFASNGEGVSSGFDDADVVDLTVHVAPPGPAAPRPDLPVANQDEGPQPMDIDIDGTPVPVVPAQAAAGPAPPANDPNVWINPLIPLEPADITSRAYQVDSLQKSHDSAIAQESRDKWIAQQQLAAKRKQAATKKQKPNKKQKTKPSSSTAVQQTLSFAPAAASSSSSDLASWTDETMEEAPRRPRNPFIDDEAKEDD